jgi:hypothetical protein
LGRGGFGGAAGAANERAISSIAAVPEALSFAPGLSPVLSRWAMTTIASPELPARVA